jgi:hypothetical protein
MSSPSGRIRLIGWLPGLKPASANLVKASTERLYFVPEGQHDSSQAPSAWTGVWTFPESLVRVFGPTGHESLAQGLPWETHPHMRSPEGATGISGYVPRRLVSGRPPGMSKRQRVECFRASGIKPKTQGKPWAKFFSPFGAGRFGLGNHAQHLTTKLSRSCREFCSPKCPNSSPGTWCLATISLSLRDKNHSRHRGDLALS